MSSRAVAHDMENLGDIEWLARCDATKREKIGAELTVNESISADRGSASSDIVVAEHHVAADEYLLDQCPAGQSVFVALEDGWNGERVAAGDRDA